MNEIKVENDEYNKNKILLQSISYSKDGKLLLKNSEKDILELLNCPRKESKKEKNTARKKSDKVKNYNVSFSLKKNKKIKKRMTDIISNTNKRFNHNSISFYPNKNNNRNENNISDLNNISNYILLQKNTGKSFTEINLSQKKDKETISLSIDNFNLNNTNDYKGNKQKFMINLNNILENNRRYINFSDNKIKLNNYINSSCKNYLSMFRYPFKLDKKCFICNCLNKKLFHAEKCQHLFCSNCGKSFYEQQINNCIYSLKCPKYLCYKNLDINVLKQFLSKYNYEKMIENIETINNTTNNILSKNIMANNTPNIHSSREKIIKKNYLFNNDSNSQSSKDNQTYLYNFSCNNTFHKDFIIDKYNKNLPKKNSELLLQRLTNIFPRLSDKDLCKKHFIKIGAISKFNRAIKKINELKNIYCSSCNKPSLLLVKNKPFIKCLNCGFSICKFCYKQYNYLHLLRNNENSCRVFFRTKVNLKFTKYIYLYQFLYIFGGFFVLYIGFTKIEAGYLSNYRKNKRYWINILLFFVLLIINFFLIIIILPYYPLFLLIVEMQI